MNRRDDIRAAMQSLLCSPRLNGVGNVLPGDSAGFSPAEIGIGEAVVPGSPSPIFQELQEALRENGIDATPSDIARALLEALAVRPSLCRGLLAAYLLGQ